MTAAYRLTAGDAVRRIADQTTIPADERNVDWIEYQEWLAAGGVPDPYYETIIDPELNSIGTGKTANQILGVT